MLMKLLENIFITNVIDKDRDSLISLCEKGRGDIERGIDEFEFDSSRRIHCSTEGIEVILCGDQLMICQSGL